MVKRILFPVLQFIAFLGLAFLGGDWDAINLGLEIRAMQNHTTPSILIPTFKTQIGNHILIENGILFASILLVIILIIQAIRKKLIPAAFFTALAYVLALVIGLSLKMGLPPAN